MMTRNQRLGFLAIAAVIAVAAVVLLSGGGDDSADTGEQAAQTATPTATEAGGGATPEATETPTPTATPRPKPPLLQAGSERELTFEEGETVRFRVRSDTDEEIHVHGYDRYVDVPAGKTVNVSFKASITGIFEIELHGSGEQIASLKVEPG
jgi:hypothetical protein